MTGPGAWDAFDIIARILVGLGVFLIAVGTIGLIRLRDAYLRINAVSKAATLGVVCVLLGVMFWNPRPLTVATLLLAVVLQLFTAPLAGYAAGRAAHRSGVPRVAGTDPDELGPHPDPVRDNGSDGSDGASDTPASDAPGAGDGTGRPPGSLNG
ncbi:monovalent cation/H(+) antiporter subunit G [Streptomyces sp. ST2-7A]|uniref:monovalent cation/H(+) antiporter subunit G n=1 Tax=Streptomyces sp. ST2-7A TaxID=2907214 RepID=UPI001F1B8F85|nr:monovalent cation/H(+) antiporter subunit G [Streptomyces sp. ST2-7A]MCE7082676.1 monovalent cation/H(+) antiporter subunit G [Streptomyces sp. ST2-7A]